MKGVSSSTSKRIRILVADDHPSVRSSLIRLINMQEDMEVVGEAADGSDALKLALALNPDVVLIDIRMPQMDGIQVIGELREAKSSARILALSAYSDEAYISEAVKRGADGYILKGTSMHKVIEAVREVVHGSTVLPPDIAESLARRYRSEQLLLSAIGRLQESSGNKSKILESFCWIFSELMGAEEWVVFSLKGRKWREIARSRGWSDDSTDHIFPERMRISSVDLSLLADICGKECPAVLSSYSGWDKSGGESIALAATVLRQDESTQYMVVCAIQNPIPVNESMRQGVSFLTAHASMLLEAQRTQEELERLAGKMCKLERVIEGCLDDLKGSGMMGKMLEAVAALLDAEQLFVFKRENAGAEEVLYYWNISRSEADRLLRKALIHLTSGCPSMIPLDMDEETIVSDKNAEELASRQGMRMLILPLSEILINGDIEEFDDPGAMFNGMLVTGEKRPGLLMAEEAIPPKIENAKIARGKLLVLIALGSFPQSLLEKRKDFLADVARRVSKAV